MKRAAATLADQTTLPVSTAILDSSGTIIAVNDAWREFGRENGFRLANSGVGANYLNYCGTGAEGASDVAAKIHSLIDGRLDLLTLVYPCNSP